MLGLFTTRRPRPDSEAVTRLKGWITDLMSLGDRDHIAIAELACYETGRPPKLTAHQRALVAQWRADGQDNAQIARALGVSRSTVSRV